MAIRPKLRPGTTTRRRQMAAAASSRTSRLARPARDPKGHTLRKTVPFSDPKPSPGGYHPGVGGAYAKAMRYLDTLTDFERLRIVRYNSNNFDLERMRTLLKKMGNPHEQFKSVHVAGTKGKGSTCAMLASMLQACGYKVGLYTSPHLNDI